MQVNKTELTVDTDSVRQYAKNIRKIKEQEVNKRIADRKRFAERLTRAQESAHKERNK
jgi:hypothetical protein